MGIKESNEITVKIKCELKEFYKIIQEKGFRLVKEFRMDDTYLIPKELKIDEMTTREILTKAILVRRIETKPDKVAKKITFKIKDFDKDGNILKQEAISCDILEIEDAKRLLKAIGYKEIMNIKENDSVYEKDGFQIAVKDIENGDNLIEIETEENKYLNTVDELIEKVNEIRIPIDTSNYFIKKAEIKLDEILKR